MAGQHDPSRAVLSIPDRRYSGLVTYASTETRSATVAWKEPSRWSSPPTRRPTGSDSATPVSDDYGPKDSTFTGRVRWVQIDIDAAAEDVDHLISPEKRLHIAMTRQ
jgi:hypothetical protein